MSIVGLVRGSGSSHPRRCIAMAAMAAVAAMAIFPAERDP